MLWLSENLWHGNSTVDNNACAMTCFHRPSTWQPRIIWEVSGRTVGISIGDCLNDAGWPSPLWVVPFPRQGFPELHEWRNWAEYKWANKWACKHPLLSVDLYWGWSLISISQTETVKSSHAQCVLSHPVGELLVYLGMVTCFMWLAYNSPWTLPLL